MAAFKSVLLRLVYSCSRYSEEYGHGSFWAARKPLFATGNFGSTPAVHSDRPGPAITRHSRPSSTSLQRSHFDTVVSGVIEGRGTWHLLILPRKRERTARELWVSHSDRDAKGSPCRAPIAGNFAKSRGTSVTSRWSSLKNASACAGTSKISMRAATCETPWKACMAPPGA